MESDASKDARTLTTYTMWSTFGQCRRKMYRRYVDELVPAGDDDPVLSFGKVIHRCLELYWSGANHQAITDYLDLTYSQRYADEEQRVRWHVATAAMMEYRNRYAAIDVRFKVLGVEQRFDGLIENPETGAASRSFTLSGRIDGLLQETATGDIYILEHKTCSNMGRGYLERLWQDQQILLYAAYIGAKIGRPVKGILYDVIGKAALRPYKGWTEDEYQEKLAEARAKNKSGQSSLKRKLPEEDADYQQRLLEWYAQPDTLVRETILVDRAAVTEICAELWELTQAYLAARKRPGDSGFYRNRQHCFHHNKPCPYWRLCASGDNPVVCDLEYTRRAPHQELLEDEHNAGE